MHLRCSGRFRTPSSRWENSAVKSKRGDAAIYFDTAMNGDTGAPAWRFLRRCLMRASRRSWVSPGRSCLSVGFLRLSLAIALALPAASQALQTYEELRNAWTSSEGELLDRNGQVIHELRVDMHSRRLERAGLHEC